MVLANVSEIICKFAAVLKAHFVPPTYRNTKRYARLVVENVRNFRKQDSVRVHAFSVGCYYCIFFQGHSHNPQLKTWYISATLRLLKSSFEVLKRKLKVAPGTYLGNNK